MEKMVYAMPAKIPMPEAVFVIMDALKRGDKGIEVYVVGGAVRDYLYQRFHGPHDGEYTPKDIDITTSLSEQEILERLRSPYARNQGIKVNEKESVDTFGVVFVNIKQENYEVAPFRRDIGSVDGRRPQRIERATVREDAMRRDLTINSLYYDPANRLILDYNPNNQGVKDIQSRKVQTVGEPFERFEEDKLRVLRTVRFFSRYNPGLIVDHADPHLLYALQSYANLYEHKGITAERIEGEFLVGLAQSLNTTAYLKNYEAIGLFQSVFPQVFPSFTYDLSWVNRLGNIKNTKVVLATLLRNNGQIAMKLNALKYPSEISEGTQFLVDALHFRPENGVELVRERDRRIVRPGKKKPFLTEEEKEANTRIAAEVQKDLSELCSVLDDPHRIAMIRHLAGYTPPVVSGEELIKEGFQGEEIGTEHRRRQQVAFVASWEAFSAKQGEEADHEESGLRSSPSQEGPQVRYSG